MFTQGWASRFAQLRIPSSDTNQIHHHVYKSARLLTFEVNNWSQSSQKRHKNAYHRNQDSTQLQKGTNFILKIIHFWSLGIKNTI